MAIITLRGTPEYNPPGEAHRPMFRMAIEWSVWAIRRPGYIVQHIQRNEKFTLMDEDIPIGGGAAIYVPSRRYVIANEYWEAWHVAANPNGTTVITPVKIVDSRRVHDVFSFGRAQYRLHRQGGPVDGVVIREKNGTQGTWKIRGRVYWVDEQGFAETHWARAIDPATEHITNEHNAVREAGMLLSRFAAPRGGDGLQIGATLGSVKLDRKHAGEWRLYGPAATRYQRRRFYPVMGSDGFGSAFVNGEEIAAPGGD